METTVAAVCKTYDRIRIKTVLQACLARLEQKEPILKTGMRVVLKPNLVSARRPEEAATTHPEFLAAIIELCLERGCTVCLQESPAGKQDEAKLRLIARRCGIQPLLDQYPIEWNPSTETILHYLPRTGIEVPVLKALAEADLVINCCKLKSHSYTGFTGAVKNHYGAISGLTKAQLHARFAKRSDFCAMIADLAESLAWPLVLMDAIVGMHKEGPTNGEPISLNRILAGTNCFAVDEMAMRLVNLPADQMPIQAAALALGCWKKEDQHWIALTPEAMEINTNFEAPLRSRGILALLPAAERTLSHWMAAYPRVDTARCLGCGECVRDCPAKTIQLKAQKAWIDHRRCIRCYCCQEVCPANAVRLKKRSLFV